MAVIEKNAKGHGYSYTDLGAILQYLETQGVEVRNTTEWVESQNQYVVTTSSRKQGESWSEWLAPVPVIVGQSKYMSQMQALGSALTYARRYSIQLALGLASTDDDGVGAGQPPIQQFTPPPSQGEVLAGKAQLMKIAKLMEQGGVTTAEQAAIALHALTGRDIKKTSELRPDEVDALLSGPELIISRTHTALNPTEEQQ